MPVAAPADKRFRRAHLKPARKRVGWGRWRWRAAALAVGLGLTGYTMHRMLVGIADMPIFRVQTNALPDVYEDEESRKM